MARRAAYNWHVTTVAYPARPQLPGWIHTTVSLLVGWVLGAAASGALYGIASLIGAIGTPYGTHPGVINEWPFHHGGLWGLSANIGVIAIALLLTSVSTSRWLRRKHAVVSDGRLAVVLLFTGWIPLVTAGPVGGLVGFLVAVVLVRHWVARREDLLPLPDAAILVGVLSVLVLSYGLLHPLWTADVFSSAPVGKSQAVQVVIRNAGLTGVTIDRLEVQPALRLSPQPSALQLGSRADRLLTLSLPDARGSCGTLVAAIHAHYHVVGIPFTEDLPVRLTLGRRC